MKKPVLIAAALALALAVVFGIVAWNTPPAATTAAAASVQVSREVGGNAAVTVTVSRAGETVLDQPGTGPDLSGMKGKVLPFAVAVDTHAGDIAKLDLNGKVFIRDAAGVEIPAIVRQLSSSAHHTTYVAVVPNTDSRGQALEDPANGHLQVIIRGVGRTPERFLHWHVQGPPPDPTGAQGAGPGSAGADGGAATGRLLGGAVALLALLGGFLALMSPCMLHTTSYWAALVTSSSAQGAECGAGDHAAASPAAIPAGVIRTVLLYIAGFTLVYVLLGTLAGAAGSIASYALAGRLAPYKLMLDVIAGLFMTLFGLHVTGWLRSAWVYRLRLPVPRFMVPRMSKTERPAAFTMGLSMALGCVTCIGGTVFLGLLAYLGTSTWRTGLQVSLLYSLGLATPLLLLTFGLGGWLTRLRTHHWCRTGLAVSSGAMLVVVGILTLVGQGELVESGLFWMVAKLGSPIATSAQHVH